MLLLPRKGELLFADGEIAAVENLGNDVGAVHQIEIYEIWFAVFDFVDGRLLGSSTSYRGEAVVVEDRGNQERLARAFAFEVVIELEFGSVLSAEFLNLLLGTRLGSLGLCISLIADGLNLVLVSFGFAGGDIALSERISTNAGLLLRFDEDFEVGFGVRIAADLAQ